MSFTACEKSPGAPVARFVGTPVDGPCRISSSLAVYTTTLMESLVTPLAVAPPLFLAAHGVTHGGRETNTILMRCAVESQFGPANAALLLMPTPGTWGPGFPILTTFSAPSAAGATSAVVSATVVANTSTADR